MKILETLLPGTQHLQNIHPLIVHFPIAFLSGAALIYVLAYGFRRDPWAKTAFWFLLLGSLTAVMAAATGLYAENGVMVAKSVREQILTPHKQWMMVAVGTSIVLTVWAGVSGGFPKRARIVFVFLCLVLTAIMAKGADYGGRMVYDYNAGGNACGQPIEFSK